MNREKREDLVWFIFCVAMCIITSMPHIESQYSIVNVFYLINDISKPIWAIVGMVYARRFID